MDSKRIFFIPLIVSLISVITFAAYRYSLSKQTVLVNSFEECIKIPGIALQTIYPATCTTPDGRSFTQPLPPETIPPISDSELSQGWYWGLFSQKKSETPDDWIFCGNGSRNDKWQKPNIDCDTAYTCPSNGWVDCMPGPKPKPECSAGALAWYKANCPDFKGSAL